MLSLICAITLLAQERVQEDACKRPEESETGRAFRWQGQTSSLDIPILLSQGTSEPRSPR
jgi:hypothetical protein